MTLPVLKLQWVRRDASAAAAQAASFVPYPGAGAASRVDKVAGLLLLAAEAARDNSPDPGQCASRMRLSNAATDALAWWPDAAPLAPADGRLRSPRPDVKHRAYARKVVRLGLGLCLECGEPNHRKTTDRLGRRVAAFYCLDCADLEGYNRAADREGMQRVLELTRVRTASAHGRAISRRSTVAQGF